MKLVVLLLAPSTAFIITSTTVVAPARLTSSSSPINSSPTSSSFLKFSIPSGSSVKRLPSNDVRFSSWPLSAEIRNEDDGRQRSSKKKNILNAVTRLSSSHPVVQLLILLIMYVFHLTVLTQNQVVFPFQLWPNNNGWFQSIGFDSLAGIISLAIALRSGKRGKGQQIGKGEVIEKEGGSSNGSTRGRSILAAPDNFDGSAPWMFPKNRLRKNSTTTSMNQWERRSPRLTSAWVNDNFVQCVYVRDSNYDCDFLIKWLTSKAFDYLRHRLCFTLCFFFREYEYIQLIFLI